MDSDLAMEDGPMWMGHALLRKTLLELRIGFGIEDRRTGAVHQPVAREARLEEQQRIVLARVGSTAQVKLGATRIPGAEPGPVQQQARRAETPARLRGRRQ